MGFTISAHTQVPVLRLTVQEVTQRWSSLFSRLGMIQGFAHEPTLDQTVTPVIQRCRRIPLALREEVSQEIHHLESEGIIEPIDSSPWISNIVVVRKKSGQIRLCVDLRSVNKAVVPDKYPLPTADELATQFHGSTVFSKLDLYQGYLQIPLTERSRNVTAFITHDGIYRFKRMPFGLSSAPSAFQKIMVAVLAGLKGVVV